MHEHELTVIVVSWNTMDMTLGCLRSLGKNIDRDTTQVLVVDNGSTDGSADAIREEFDWLELIAHDEDLGFARANNLASQRATGRRLLLLNPDTVVLDGAIDAIVRCADENPDAGIWGGRTLFGDGSLNHDSCCAKPTLWSAVCDVTGFRRLFKGSHLFDREEYGWWQRDTPKRVDIVSGCFLLIDRSLWEELDGFDRDFFMYGEETDLCIRAGKLGYRPLITPEATIIHYGGASERVLTEKLVKLYDARARLIRRHWSLPARPFGLALLAVRPFLRASYYRLRALSGTEKARETARSWQSVWSRRNEWLDPTPFDHAA